jgi:hypothetical protein
MIGFSPLISNFSKSFDITGNNEIGLHGAASCGSFPGFGTMITYAAFHSLGLLSNGGKQLGGNTSDASLLPPPALSVTLIRFLLFAGDSLPVVMLLDFIHLICNNRTGCGVGVTSYSCSEEIPNHH